MSGRISLTIFVMLMLVVLSGAMAPIGKAAGSETTLFSDDFESYPVDTFPSAGGWQIVWGGTGQNFVTDAYSFSPTKSFQLWGRPSWASVAQKKFSTDVPVIGYELAICIDSIGTPGPGAVEHFGFFNREAYIWGAYYAMAKFNHNNGKIEADEGTVLGDWVPGVWYQVKVVLDRSTNTYSVWIDGELRGEGLSTTRSDTHLINALALVSAHAGVKVYYDDARVFEITNDPPVADAGPDQTVIVGETCTFDGSGSYDPDGTIVSWEWDFDDATTGSGEITTHEYSLPGEYTVTLTVTDDYDATDTDTATVTVQTPAEATEDLMFYVQEIDLPEGIENSLVSKLEAAIKSLDRGRENAAENQLNAFINQVEAQRGKKISDADADALVAAAQAIIDALMDE